MKALAVPFVAAMLAIAAPSAIPATTNPTEAALQTPDCVRTNAWTDGIWQRAKAQNLCGTTKRFYFRWDRAVDGGCRSLESGYERTEGRLYQARFAGLTDC